MAARTWGEEYRTTFVCVDSYSDRIPQGRFYNSYLPDGKSFQSLMQFLTEMEQVLEQMDFPSAFSSTRAFLPVAKPAAGPPGTEPRMGELATFAIRILFRQNASWQGSVTWLEGKQEESFRSVLELLLLINSALTGKNP